MVVASVKVALSQGPDQLYKVLQARDDTEARLDRVYVYASLLADQDTRVGEHQAMRSRARSLAIGYGQAIVLGFLISLFGQLGDLAESLLKRNTGVKDSGGWLAGHGGFLDRIDSIVFAGIVVYYYVVWAI